MYQAYTEMFRLLLSQGKSHLEAYREFDEENLMKAFRAAMDDGDRDAFMELLDLFAKAGEQQSDEKDREQCFDLWGAGWSHEKVSKSDRPMSWYWRSPPKGKRPLGRRYLSTNQAWMTMRRQAGLSTEGSR